MAQFSGALVPCRRLAQLKARGMHAGGRTLKVLDAEVLYLLWVRQEGFTQDVDGTHVSELPVSKQPVNCLGGVPIWNTPKYCRDQHTHSTFVRPLC